MSATKVFVHGNPEVDAIWRPLVGELRSRGIDDLTLLSPPGFGAPTPAGWRADTSSYRAWLIGELEQIGGAIDLVGHDWGAGHVFGAVTERPHLVRSFAADCAGLLHPDYVWHDVAQAWQTPDVGEQVIAMMVDVPPADRTAFYLGLGAPETIALEMAEGADSEMGRCILALYRSAVQPAAAELGRRLLAGERPPCLVIVAPDDPYVSSSLSSEMAIALGAQQLLLEGCGHWWMFQQPGAAADGLVEFWANLD